jgi:ferredoxin-like protein FixX
MSGIRHHHRACIDVKDRACVDVCPVQCIYPFDPKNNVLFFLQNNGSVFAD